jgi:hypothetical protein
VRLFFAASAAGLALSLAGFLSGCDAGSTPVKYERCNASGDQCEVKARFHTFEDCQRHRTFANALCDSTSVPGTITCETCPGQPEGCTMLPTTSRCTN